MNWRIFILLAVMPSAMADGTANTIALGRSARADGVPQAAIHDLERVAKKGGAREVEVLVELARCLIASDREAEAIAWLEKTERRDEPDVIFWRAQAQAQHQDYGAALADYERAMAIDFPLQQDARFGRARMLEAVGRWDEALPAYEEISMESPRYRAAQLAAAALLIKQGKKKDAAKLLVGIKGGTRDEQDMLCYLQARVKLESGDAGSLYRDFRPVDPRLAAGAVIGLSDVLLRTGSEDRAEESLESFLRDNPDSPLLHDVLAKLDEVRARQKAPSTSTLKLWENDEKHAALSQAATFYLARNDERQDRRERAIRNYSEFLDRHPDSELHTATIIRLASLFIAAKQIDEALRILPKDDAAPDRAGQARIRYLRGMTQYLSLDYPTAAKTFIGAANLDPKLSEPALANAAIAAIYANNEPQAAEILNALRKENATVARRIELAEAFFAARAGDPDVGERLAWIADRGGMVGDRARLALAESRWLAGDRATAKSEFLRVANSKAVDRGDHADYFAVYLTDDGSVEAVAPVSEAAREFLAGHPDSSREADVRMKWGEVLMRSGDFLGARVQFAEAARSAGDPSTKQSAWFFAARAAMASMNRQELESAVQMLEDVAQEKEEPLASQARFQQALLQAALDRPKDSVSILDSLISDKTPPRLRFAAQLKKGEVLYSMAAQDRSQAHAAIKEWRSVASDKEATAAERNEALTRAAAASHLAGDNDAALADYYQVLTSPRDKEPEYFWYYKAGFEAAQLLEAGNRYKEASAIYEKMASAPGPRAEEFQERVKRLRLEKFIWED